MQVGVDDAWPSGKKQDGKSGKWDETEEVASKQTASEHISYNKVTFIDIKEEHRAGYILVMI